MAENKYNLYELQKKIPYELVAPIITAWDEQSDNDVTDLARMAYDIGRNSISKEQNKMEKIAGMFGKELGERFDVVICGDRFTVYFTETGMEHEADVKEFNWYNLNSNLLEGVLTGRAVIINE